ncbi:MAG TPA: sigma-70 family RNA polymerase sigma factor [Verrucomicrobiota bacterium]|nr:sigma-70 family RNA polymerase sigma factor [Verrucomicrobiota bacterium]HNU52073.1 sigma-70 family RNA polymerase sigma factor [Verrucomicrobiota bacterium]
MGPEHDPDAALMLRVKRGDRAAFEALVDKYKQPVFNLIYRTLPDAAEAEDLAQNVFLQVHRFAHRYKPSAKFTTWLFTIARNLCLNEIRRRGRHPAESLSEPSGDRDDEADRPVTDRQAVAPDQGCLDRELAALVDDALRALPENQRVAMLLCREEEQSYEDIAAILGCSLAATKSLIHRARETLKLRLKRYLRTGAWTPDAPSRPQSPPEKPAP